MAAAAIVLSSCSNLGSPARTTSPFGVIPGATASSGKIQHVVIIVQENRSFDNFFDCFPGTDCVKTAAGHGPKPGPTTKQSPCPDVVPTPTPGPTRKPIEITFGAHLASYDPNHSYCPAFRVEYDAGRMDGFYWNGGLVQGEPDKRLVYQVVAEKNIQPYWDMATQYVLGDRMFPTQSSGSFTAHQDLIRGNAELRSNATAVDFPWNQRGINNWGCDDPTEPSKGGPSYTPLLTDTLKYIRLGPPPCFNYETMRDTLDAKGATWKYYVPVWPNTGGQMWNAFDAISAVRYGNDGEWPPRPIKPFNCPGSCVSWPETNVLCDVAGTIASPCPSPSPPGEFALPAVSWVIPDGEDSDHYSPLGDNGPDWVGVRRQRDRREPLLEVDRDRHRLGRLGRLVRSRAAAAAGLYRARVSRADDRGIAICQERSRRPHAIRVRQHFEIRRVDVRPSELRDDRRESA